MFLALATTAFGGPKGCFFSLAIIAFGAFGLIVPKYDCRLGKRDITEPRLLNLRRSRSSRSVELCAEIAQFRGRHGGVEKRGGWRFRALIFQKRTYPLTQIITYEKLF